VSPVTTQAFLDEQPWRAFDAEVSGVPYVLFQAMPLDIPAVECLRDRLYDPRYLQRGLLLSMGSSLDVGNNVSDVDVFANETFLTPSIYGRVPSVAMEWRPSPAAQVIRQPALNQVRVYLPMDALDPHDGRFPAVVLRVWNAHLRMIPVQVPDTLTKRLWGELLPWRIEQRRSALTGGAAAVPIVPLPNDQTLAVAVARYGQGDVAGGAEKAAAWRALDRARSGGIEADARPELRRDRLIADVMVGGVLAAAGDSVAGTALAVDALATAPCLVPTTSATGPYAATLTRLRPNVRCSVLPSSAVVRRGLLFPGGGHAVVGDRARANRAMTVVGLAFGGAITAAVASSQRYSHYEEQTSVEGAQKQYDRAASMRTLATGLAVGGAVVWLADMGYAVRREKRHTDRVRAQQSFGRGACGTSATPRCTR
jgi:hypothetical protein